MIIIPNIRRYKGIIGWDVDNVFVGFGLKHFAKYGLTRYVEIESAVASAVAEIEAEGK